MKHVFAHSFSAAAISLALVSAGPMMAQATDQSMQNSSTMQQSQMSQEASDMVAATVDLAKSLDAKKAQPGSTFEAKVEQTVHLKNGPEIPKGSTLVGQVATDDMNQSGNSKLALRFTEAKLKDGKTVPVHATIVGVFPPTGYDVMGNGNTAKAEAESSSWNARTLRVDQIGAISGVDLHSNVTSKNSGVLVTTKKDDVKLREGSQFALAICAANNGTQQSQNGTGSGQ